MIFFSICISQKMKLKSNVRIFCTAEVGRFNLVPVISQHLKTVEDENENKIETIDCDLSCDDKTDECLNVSIDKSRINWDFFQNFFHFQNENNPEGIFIIFFLFIFLLLYCRNVHVINT